MAVRCERCPHTDSMAAFTIGSVSMASSGLGQRLSGGANDWPNVAHFGIVQLPWDTIYTTNYDTLIEKAAATPGIHAAGMIAPVFSATKDVTDFTEDHIIY